MEAPAVAGATIELIEMLAGVDLAALDLEAGLDDVGDVAKDRRRPLLAILLPDFIAEAAVVAGILLATSLRRSDVKRIGLRTWIRVTIQRISGFQ